MDLLGSQRRMLEQAFTQVSEVSVRVSLRRDALVYLSHMYAFPRHIFVREGAQHLPRRVAAADSHDKTAAREDRRPSICGNGFRRLPRHCISVGKYFNLHRSS